MSIEYYNQNAEAFRERTLSIDMSEAYAAFLKYIPLHAHICDAGCGVGRDAKYFKDDDYRVTAFDASAQMVDFASELLGQPVQLLTFDAMPFEHVFDGLWCEAALIHVPYSDLASVFSKFHRALKPEGILWVSFKYGYGKRSVLGRDFYDMDEAHIREYLGPHFDILGIWQVPDMRSRIAPSRHNAWLKVLAKSG
ncbi:MAG TPA: class I SAM-dependent methyltransferase [Opitutales bacterium]|nr:class I SAM-dependent methyltransferase [Opitutales bacterium]